MRKIEIKTVFSGRFWFISIPTQPIRKSCFFMSKPYTSYSTKSFNSQPHKSKSSSPNSTNQMRFAIAPSVSRAFNKIDIDPDDRFCLKCSEILPKWTPTLRLYTSDFCAGSCKQNYYKKINPVKIIQIRLNRKLYDSINNEDKEKYIHNAVENKITLDYLTEYYRG